MSVFKPTTVDDDLMSHLSGVTKAAGMAPKEAPPPRSWDYTGLAKVSDYFSIPIPTGMDFPIKKFEDTDWHESVRRHIPEPDEAYVFPPKETLIALASLMRNKRLLIHGPAGSGKTSLPKEICARLRIPYVRVNCRMDMESSAFFGSVVYSQDSGVTFVEGPMAEFARHGGLFCIDEISRTPAGINAALMSILERNGIVFLSDKPGTVEDKTIMPNEWFRIVATDNTELQGDTTGRHAGTMVQDSAMIDRFAATIRLGYLEAAHEISILSGKVPLLDKAIIRQIVQMANLVRSAFNAGSIGLGLSPRGLIEWAEDTVFWGDVKQAFLVTFFNKLTDGDKAIVGEYFHTVFGENL